MQVNLGELLDHALVRKRNNLKRNRMARASTCSTIPRAIRSLYEPQLKQFGIEIHRDGEGWSGTGRSAWGSGSVWGIPVGDFCIAFSHEVYIEREMALVESPESPYACVCIISEDSKATMPRMIDRPKALLDGSLYSFVQPAGKYSGTLRSGGLYSSRCICFLPQYFEELDQRWPNTFSDLFMRFDKGWNEAESRIIMSTLLGTGPQYQPGSALLIEARIKQMVAMLASSRNSNAAKHHSGTANEQARLALKAQALIERMLDEGRAPTINELANVLFVSRSHLCSAFLHETGQSIGRYAKTRRIERAKTLIASGCPVAQIATHLGWTRCSAFSQAFKQSTGVSPTEWRNLNLDSPNSKTYSSTRTIQSQ